MRGRLGYSSNYKEIQKMEVPIRNIWFYFIVCFTDFFSILNQLSVPHVHLCSLIQKDLLLFVQIMKPFVNGLFKGLKIRCFSKFKICMYNNDSPNVISVNMYLQPVLVNLDWNHKNASGLMSHFKREIKITDFNRTTV